MAGGSEKERGGETQQPAPRSAQSAGWLAEPWRLQVYRQPLLWLALALLAGVKLGQAWPLSLWLVLTVIVALLTAAFLCQRRGQAVLSGSLALAAALCWGCFYAIVNAPPASDSLSAFATRQAEPIAVRCMIRSAAVWKPNLHHRPQDPRSEAWQTTWEVRCDEVRDGHSWKPVRAYSTLVVQGRIDDLYPGDWVQVLGSIRRISAPTNPGAFDFAAHFRRDAQFTALSAESRGQLKRLAVSGHYALPRLRAWWVQAVDQSLHRWVPWGQAPLAAALVFGQREQVDWEDQQELMATGTLHLLAISGMHVEIVAAVILLCAAPFSLRQQTVLIVLVGVCGAYAALAGGKPPVLRAVMVVSAFALARTLGRQARLSNVLSLAAIVLLLVRVANIDNVGVHLSFLAVGTIGVFVLHSERIASPKTAWQNLLEESLSGWRRWGWLFFRSCYKMWLLSVWVWLLTCPLVWANFHIVAPVAMPLNVLLAFPLMFSLVAGLATGLSGGVPLLAWPAGVVCGGGLTLISHLVHLGKSLPLGHFWLPAPPLWWIVGFYAIAAAWLAYFGRGKHRLLLGFLFCWLAMGLAPYALAPLVGDGGGRRTPLLQPQRPAVAAAQLRCTFLDVGHGTSVLIELPRGDVWLYDAGHLGAAVRSHQDIAHALWQVPTARIDKLFLSHADADHYNATQGLAERFTLGSIASTQQFWRSPDRHVVALRDSLDRRTPLEELQAGSFGRAGEVAWRVLHPPRGWAGKNDNDASLCLLLEYAGKRLLLPGDLEGAGLLNLVELPPRPCHVLMAPHHGSLTLDPSELLLWCRPQVVVISGNHRATRPEVLHKYSITDSQVGITFRDGAIQIRIDGQGQLSTWHWAGDGWAPL
ncbi:MAG: ComEC/Rec2 family competence protein [Planctomycetales bacterium]|nr:ComEC/Rec2 family competence protein [Planctomycetales bacterium]